MIHDNLEFYNVAELVAQENTSGLRLQRVPESVRTQLDEGTAGTMLSPANCEIRFRLTDDSESVTLTLSSDGRAQVYIYHGPFQGQMFTIGDDPTDIVIKPHKRLALLSSEQANEYRYHPDLVRVCFGDDYPEPITYLGHQGGVLPPRKSDTPEKTYLAYGSSITHGIKASGAALSYPAHVAWKKNMNLRNLGASGCCLCEPAMGDFLAEQDCDLMTLELSVNMLGRGIGGEEFKQKAEDLVRKVADAKPERPVVCITIFPHYNDMGPDLIGGNETATSEEYRDILRSIVNELDRPNLHLVEGPSLMTNLEDLRMDLIHPGARGMIEIGENLTKEISHII